MSKLFARICPKFEQDQNITMHCHWIKNIVSLMLNIKRKQLKITKFNLTKVTISFIHKTSHISICFYKQKYANGHNYLVYSQIKIISYYFSKGDLMQPSFKVYTTYC